MAEEVALRRPTLDRCCKWLSVPHRKLPIGEPECAIGRRNGESRKGPLPSQLILYPKAAVVVPRFSGKIVRVK